MDGQTLPRMSIAIIDYEAGNLTSVLRAVHALGLDATITSDPSFIDRADRVIFPGVGAAGQCMASLKKGGLDGAISRAVQSGRPFLGICVGMQLLFDWSEEDGGIPCLGILPGKVERIRPNDPKCKVPHMGWNPVRADLIDPLFQGIPQDTSFYFVHSYACQPSVEVQTIGTCQHGQSICSAVRRKNLAAVQFHPEKSGPWGLQLLKNFLTLS